MTTSIPRTAANEVTALWHLLAQAVSRVKQRRAVEGAAWGVVVGAVAALIACGVLAQQGTRWFASPNELRTARAWILLWPALGAAVGWSILRWWPVSTQPVAQAIDRHGKLQDRLSSAWTFAQQGPVTSWTRLQLQDTLDQLRDFRPSSVFPPVFPRPLYAGAILWVIALLLEPWSDGAVAMLARQQAQQIAQDDANQHLATQLERTLLQDLKRLAALTGTSPPDELTLQDLATDVEQQLDRLRRPGMTRDESLATLSEIQAAIAKSQTKFDSAPAQFQLQQIAQALADTETLSPVADSLQQQDYEQAARQLEQADTTRLTDQERQSLADDLRNLAPPTQPRGSTPLHEAAQQWRQALEQNDSNAMTAAQHQMAAQMQQQAGRMEIETQLQQQMTRLAEAKGASSHGGSNTDPSQQDRSTYGHGKAGDPRGAADEPLATTRQREELTGQQGEGPTQRESTPSEQAPAAVTREYQAKFDQYHPMAEAVLRHEALPLGHRATIRRYFESLRP